MNYRTNKKGEQISVLGYGCMRFSKTGRSIDIDKAEKEIISAFNKGVNYYDTAYLYPGSEAALGEILKRNNCREKINIATKLPLFMVRKSENIDKFFDEQLRRLQTNYVDYYLMHMLTDIAEWDKLKRFGIEEWIAKKKESGQIKNIGFSYHGNTEMFIQILNAYDWDFCQIQYNYVDETSQAGRKGMQAAHDKGLPVIIMEPLRGGKLVDLLPEKAKKLIAENDRKWSPAELAFRWLWDQPEVSCVLSGMNSMEMVEENTKTAAEAVTNSFTEADFKLIEEVKKEIEAKTKVGCTGCGYCQPCPQGVDIPGVFKCYNTMYTENKKEGRHAYSVLTGMRKQSTGASQCIGCGKCEQHCPQHINIRQELKNAKKELETPAYKVISKAIQLMLRKD